MHARRMPVLVRGGLAPVAIRREWHGRGGSDRGLVLMRLLLLALPPTPLPGAAPRHGSVARLVRVSFAAAGRRGAQSAASRWQPRTRLRRGRRLLRPAPGTA